MQGRFGIISGGAIGFFGRCCREWLECGVASAAQRKQGCRRPAPAMP